MSGFLKVHSADGPSAPFYAPEQWVAAHPNDYKVLDKKPVDSVPAVLPAAEPASSKPAKASAADGGSK